MKKIIFATSNPAKAKRFSGGLLKIGIEVLTCADLQIKLKAEETGTSAVENALIKARACHKKTGLPSFATDDALYLENVPEDRQPGLFVRRVHGKTLNDEEMLKYYTDLVKQYGTDGKLNCKWVYGLAVIADNGKENTYTWLKDNFYMVQTISGKIHPGYPLNSISKYKMIDRYFTDLTEEDRLLLNKDETDVIQFIAEHL